MKTNNKLVSLLKGCIFSLLIAFTPGVYAEYYVVYGPSEPCCETTTVQRVYIPRPHHYHRHHYHHRHYVDSCRDVDSCGQVVAAPRRSSYSISVSYACPSYGCCGNPYCNGGVVTETYNSGTYYDNIDYKEPCFYTQTCQSQSVTYYYGNDFDYDRRTADDVGADLDIDY
ncbi:MAG: hypothetical protein ACYCQI_10105 [Gammaproteobacteria bacterium]